MLPLAIPVVRVPQRALAAATAIGLVVAALAASVSFLEDESPPQATPQASGPYYERIDPPPGRPWNRYRIDYIPFKTALTSGHWSSSDRPAGNGPDIFALHLARARVTMPGGATIPAWLPWAVSLPWVALLAIETRRVFGMQPSG